MNRQFQQLRLRLRPYSQTIRLAMSYLVVIMVMSLSFSVIVYHTSAREIGRQLPPNSLYSNIGDDDHTVFDIFFQTRIDNARHELFTKLFLINLLVLTGGAFVSYILARRSLEPIEEAMEAQSRFASDASHELRTPLAAIQTENEVALRNPKLTLAHSKQLLASNLEEVTRLQSLSEGLLKLARRDGQDITLGPVKLSGAIKTAVGTHSKPAKAKGITINATTSSITVLADEQALAQAIGILLDNAIKYSPRNTALKITTNSKGKFGHINVSDQGPGIQKADIERIFERFYRADSSRTSQAVSGHGLGLALAEKLVTQQGGSISVKSKFGFGACFTIQLPIL